MNTPAAHGQPWLMKLAWLEPFWVLLLGILVTLFGRSIPGRYYPYILFGFFLFWPIRWLTYGSLTRRSPVDWGIALLLLSTAAGLWSSIDRSTSWIVTAQLIFGITLFGALINWPPAQKRPQLLVLFLFLSGTAILLVAPSITAWKPEYRLFQMPRLYDFLQTIAVDVGETLHANVLAGYLVIIAPLFLALALQWNWPTQSWLRVLYGTFALIALALVVVTQSRGAYVAATISTTFVIALRWPRSVLLLPPAAIALVGIVRWIGFDRVLNLISSDSALGGIDVRVELWRNSVLALSDFGFTGIGIGTFGSTMPIFYRFTEAFIGSPSFVHAHNLYLQIGLDVGLPGLIAWLSVVINVLVILTSALRHPRYELTWPLAVGALGGIVAMLIHGLLDTVTWGTKLAFYPWVLFALAVLVGLYQVEKQDEGSR